MLIPSGLAPGSGSIVMVNWAGSAARNAAAATPAARMAARRRPRVNRIGAFYSPLSASRISEAWGGLAVSADQGALPSGPHNPRFGGVWTGELSRSGIKLSPTDLERRDMAKRRRSSLALSGEHARQALAILIQEGKLRAGEVRKALQRRDRLIRALRSSLAALETGAVSVGKRLFKGSPAKARKARTARRKVARRKPRISAATRKIYQQQGR